MTVVSFSGPDWRRFAESRAAQLKPKGMDAAAGAIWDEDAPAMADRLAPENVREFRHYCEAVARYQAAAREWAASGKISITRSARSGEQIRNRPEFAQMNEFFSQAVRLAAKFGKFSRGKTPAGASLPSDPAEDDFD